MEVIEYIKRESSLGAVIGCWEKAIFKELLPRKVCSWVAAVTHPDTVYCIRMHDGQYFGNLHPSVRLVTGVSAVTKTELNAQLA